MSDGEIPVTAYAWTNNDGPAPARKFDVQAFIDGEGVDRKRIEAFGAASQRLLELDKVKFKTAGAHTLVIKGCGQRRR